jgi:chromate transporter
MRELLIYFLRLGTLGFGGPIALVGSMQRDLVEERRWISKRDYSEGLALAQLAPCPLAAQLATYLGWVRGGTLGATLVVLTFVLPSFVMVMALSALYLRFGGLLWMQGAFYGIGAAVIALIGRSAYKLAVSTLGKDRLLGALFAVSALVTAWTESEVVWLFVVAGAVSLLARAAPRLSGRSVAWVVPAPWLVTACTERARASSGRCSATSPRPALSFSAAGSRSSPSCTLAWSGSMAGSRSGSSSMPWPLR